MMMMRMVTFMKIEVMRMMMMMMKKKKDDNKHHHDDYIDGYGGDENEHNENDHGNDDQYNDLLSVGAHPLNPKVKPLAVSLRVQVRPDHFVVRMTIMMIMIGPFALPITPEQMVLWRTLFSHP